MVASFRRAWLAAFLVLALAGAAQAQQRAQQQPGQVYAQSTQAMAPSGGSTAKADDPAFWAFSAGWYDLNKQKDQAFEGRIEYRGAEKYWIFKPFGGIMATSDRAVHGFAGVLVDLYFGRRWVLTPSFAPGLYYEGDGKHISNGIQFRSQLELSYRFDDRSRLGISINHISNAGINSPNPGAETLAITYAIPTDKLFKW